MSGPTPSRAGSTVGIDHNRTMTAQSPTIGVVGAGSWGTALAAHLAAQGLRTTLWAREPEVVAGIATDHVNPLFLTGVALPAALQASGDLPAVLADADVVVSAVPVPFLRTTLAAVSDQLARAEVVVTVSKGIEPETLALPHELIAELGVPAERIVALSGPSFAKEVATQLPAAVVAAGIDPDRTLSVQELFATDRFRVYTSDDVVGAEIGGAMKNVVALAAGVSDGLDLGLNARAAIITRWTRGDHPARRGDGRPPLDVLRVVGRRRPRPDVHRHPVAQPYRRRRDGRGRRLAEIRAEMHEVAEGVSTCRWAYELAGRVGVEMPITEQMYRLLHEDRAPLDAMRTLLGRPLRHERHDHEPS